MSAVVSSIIRELCHYFPSFFFTSQQTNEEDESLVDQEKKSIQTFVDGFRKKHENYCPEFIAEPLREALNESLADQKPLILYFHNKYHENSERFCNEILCDKDVSETIHENFLFWGCDISTEYAFEHLMRLPLPLTKFPCIYIVRKYHIDKPTRIYGSIQGCSFVYFYIYIHVHNNLNLFIYRTEEERSLREQQQQEYQNALERDRILEEERKKEEERQNIIQKQKEEEEKMKLDEENKYKLHIEEIRSTLPSPPSNGRGIRISLPNGQRFQQIVDPSISIQYLFDITDIYLYDHNIHIRDFELVTNMPKKTFSRNDTAILLKDEYPSGNIAFFIKDLNA
ncbi:hypothetical protein WA158_002937 [Blastocystis sp. Blastoise]